MKVGFFSPLPPARTGVADYSFALLAELRKLGEVGVNEPDADICVYHLGNNPLHARIYHCALERAGLVVLHDAVLHHFLLGTLDESRYVEEFVYNYGRWTEGLARELYRNRARSGSDPLYFGYPLLRRIVERARGVVVHNPGAAQMVRDHAPAARLYEIPHLYAQSASPPDYEVQRLRASLGIPPSTFLFGVFGHLRESKRLATVLRAFRLLHGAGERIALLIAGAFASSDLERAMREGLGSAGIRRVGYTPDMTFRTYAQAVDACVNLRYPAAGETSGIAIRLMGAGKPVIVSNGPETSDIPDTAAIRVDSGPSELEMLTEYMLWLARFPSDARAIGVRAGQHIAQHHSPSGVAQMYWQALSECRA